MTQFEVSDRFAGKKGPCPKCGHMIEIPKANVKIVGPDEIVVDGKKVYNPEHVRPIEQKSYSFTGHALFVNLAVFAAVLAVALVFHFIHAPFLAVPVGIALVLAIAYPLMKYGYMTFRDPDDLEILLGGELGKKSIIGAAVFLALWLIYELILLYMNPGGMALAYLVPIALFAAFVPVVIFDMDFTDALAVAVVFLLAVILLRGLMFSAEGGWIWQRHETRRAAPAAVSGPGDQTADEGEESEPAAGDDADSGQPEEAAPAARRPAKRPKLDANAPDPTAVRRRR